MVTEASTRILVRVRVRVRILRRQSVYIFRKRMKNTIKHPHSVKFCSHFKNGKFQRSSGSSKMQGVLFVKREEKRSSLIRLIRRTKKKSRTASSKYVKNTCIK